MASHNTGKAFGLTCGQVVSASGNATQETGAPRCLHTPGDHPELVPLRDRDDDYVVEQAAIEAAHRAGKLCLLDDRPMRREFKMRDHQRVERDRKSRELAARRRERECPECEGDLHDWTRPRKRHEVLVDEFMLRKAVDPLLDFARKCTAEPRFLEDQCRRGSQDALDLLSKITVNAIARLVPGGPFRPSNEWSDVVTAFSIDPSLQYPLQLLAVARREYFLHGSGWLVSQVRRFGCYFLIDVVGAHYYAVSVTRELSQDDRRIIEMLLLISGLEPNPGPAKWSGDTQIRGRVTGLLTVGKQRKLTTFGRFSDVKGFLRSLTSNEHLMSIVLYPNGNITVRDISDPNEAPQVCSFSKSKMNEDLLAFELSEILESRLYDKHLIAYFRKNDKELCWISPVVSTAEMRQQFVLQALCDYDGDYFDPVQFAALNGGGRVIAPIDDDETTDSESPASMVLSGACSAPAKEAERVLPQVLSDRADEDLELNRVARNLLMYGTFDADMQPPDTPAPRPPSGPAPHGPTQHPPRRTTTTTVCTTTCLSSGHIHIPGGFSSPSSSSDSFTPSGTPLASVDDRSQPIFPDLPSSMVFESGLTPTSRSQSPSVNLVRQWVRSAETDAEIRGLRRPQVPEVVASARLIYEVVSPGYGTVRDPQDRVRFEYVFHGKMCPLSYEPDDPMVRVKVHKNGTLEVLGNGHRTILYHITKEFYTIAARSCLAEDRVVRCRNIMAALRQEKNIREIMERDPIYYNDKIEEICFFLAGITSKEARMSWLSAFGEFVPSKYTCVPPDDWRLRLPKTCHIWEDYVRLEANWCTGMRAGPVRVRGVVPECPDCADPLTNIAGLCKRLYPVLPLRLDYMRRRIAKKVKEFCDWCDRCDFSDMPSKEELLVEAVRDRKKTDAERICAGFYDYVDEFTHDNTHHAYLMEKYKAFWKKECYPRGSRKPPRYIMSLQPYFRGVQIAAMCQILWKVERATEKCNVKHLNADQITEKLKRKFKDVDLVAETDFSSFESCIDPEMKHMVENAIFRHLAGFEDPYAVEFIDEALEREEVFLVGPGFYDTNFHHIRMSGDYWTSLGNLLTNLIVLSACADCSVEHMMEVGLFEGDDGTFPAPKDTTALKAAAHDAGVLLTFDVAPWHALSFCGNQFHEDLEGNLIRCRDPYKTLANVTVLYSPDKYDGSKDLMLERSKALSVLSGPWVPGASAFCAIFEFYSRFEKVGTDWLREHRKLNEWSPFGIEDCVPKWLAECNSVWKLQWEVARRDLVAGGIVGFRAVKRILEQMHLGEITEPIIPEESELVSWYKRDGFQATCCPLILPRFPQHYEPSLGMVGPLVRRKLYERSGPHGRVARAESVAHRLWKIFLWVILALVALTLLSFGGFGIYVLICIFHPSWVG